MEYQPNFCTGGTASATRYYGSYTPAKAFDGLTNTYWDGYPWQAGDYLQYDLGAGVSKVAAQYTIRSGSINYPKSWVFAGSNDGENWTTIDTQTDQVLVKDTTHAYNGFVNETAYRYYRWTFNAMNAGNEPYLAEVEAMEYEDENVTVVSGPLAVAAALSATPVQQLAAPPFAVAAGLDISGIFTGRFIVAEPLSVAGQLGAKLGLIIVPPPLAIGAGLAANVAALIAAPPFAAAADLSVKDALVCTFVAAEPLAAQAGISAKLKIMLASPALAGIAALSGGLAVRLPAEPLSVAAGLEAAGVVTFIDQNYQITYICTLGDLTLPITSFQARFKSGDPSFLSVVVPGLDLADDIAARVGGLLRIYMIKTYSDGNQTREMLGEVTQDALRLDEGARNQSITIDGHGTYTHSSKAVTLKHPQYKAVYGGTTRYRCSPDFHVRPGDTATIGDDTLLISAITWAVTVGSELMEISSEE